MIEFASPGVWTGFSSNQMAGHFARSCDALAAGVAGHDRQESDALRCHDGGQHAAHPQIVAGPKLIMAPSIMFTNAMPDPNRRLCELPGMRRAAPTMLVEIMIEFASPRLRWDSAQIPRPARSAAAA